MNDQRVGYIRNTISNGLISLFTLLKNIWSLKNQKENIDTADTFFLVSLLSNRIGSENGGAMRDRTADLLDANQALSQLSYSPKITIRMVGLGRLELPTSPLSGVRSNQLSYRPKNLYPGLKTLSGYRYYYQFRSSNSCERLQTSMTNKLRR